MKTVYYIQILLVCLCMAYSCSNDDSVAAETQKAESDTLMSFQSFWGNDVKLYVINDTLSATDFHSSFVGEAWMETDAYYIKENGWVMRSENFRDMTTDKFGRAYVFNSDSTATVYFRETDNDYVHHQDIAYTFFANHYGMANNVCFSQKGFVPGFWVVDVNGETSHIIRGYYYIRLQRMSQEELAELRKTSI